MCFISGHWQSELVILGLIFITSPKGKDGGEIKTILTWDGDG